MSDKNLKLFSQILILIMIFLAVFVVILKELRKDQRSLSKNEKMEINMGRIFIEAEIVSSAEDRMKGLSGRNSLSEDEGMFFIFPKRDFHGIWMKEMSFPIDILWIKREKDGRKQIVSVLENVLPETYPKVFYPTEKADYVLEIQANLFRNSGAKIGDDIIFHFQSEKI